jgi:hypothetical protein
LLVVTEMFVLAAATVAETKAKTAVKIALFICITLLLGFRLQSYDNYETIVAPGRD